MSLPETLYGKRASILVTGASSGLGAALAEHLGGYGGKIALVARRDSHLHQVADRVRRQGGHPLPIVSDVADRQAVIEAHERIVAEQGPVDVAFLNAGTSFLMSLPRFDAQRIQRLFEVNVFGVANWMEVLLPEMISRRQGTLAVTSSLGAARSFPGLQAYSASKVAVSALLDGYRAEAACYGIQITLVEPGFIRTPLTEDNPISMPFMMDAAEAARIIAEGVAEEKRLIRFPWQVAAMMQIFRHLPDGLYDKFGASQVEKRLKKKRELQ